MTSAKPPVWPTEKLDEEGLVAESLFREERLEEPLEQYLKAFDTCRGIVEDLLETTVDLSRLLHEATAVVTNPDFLLALRYLAGPPISQDDLKVLAEASLAPTRLKNDPEMAQRVIETVLIGLDRSRFPWVSEDRDPTGGEREAAALASAALMASQRVQTDRRSEGKTSQEQSVKDRLILEGFKEVPAHTIRTTADLPGPGEFCGEAPFGSRKADIVVRLWDNRAMPIECKVSNSSTNSVKRLNNDAAKKAVTWLKEWGTVNIVPAAVLAGVFNTLNLEQAQRDGLTVFWAHDLDQMVEFIDSTKIS